MLFLDLVSTLLLLPKEVDSHEDLGGKAETVMALTGGTWRKKHGLSNDLTVFVNEPN